MTPTPCVAALALASCPLVATFHASGELSWLKLAKPAWGFLLDRLDHRIAVSEPARETASRYFPGDYELIPNGVLVPDEAEARLARGAHRVRRPARAAQGPAGAAARLAGDPAGAPGRGCAWSAPTRSPSGSLRAAARAGRGRRRARLPLAGRADCGAAPREGARRAIARRRELRDGAHTRVRVRDAGRRLGHLRATGSHGAAKPAGSCRPASRGPSPTRSSICSRTSPRAKSSARAARVIAQERYSWERIAQRLSEIYEGSPSRRSAFAA